MTPEDMRRVYDEHIAAENRCDVDAVMATFDDECHIDNVPFAARVEGQRRIATAYRLLFAAFPDGNRTLEGYAAGPDVLAGWGLWRGTLLGEYMGVAPTGRSMEVPFVTIMSFGPRGLIRGERVFYDTLTLCAQAGIPVDALRAAAGMA